MNALKVYGHERTLEELRGPLSSSLLFVGPTGVGRRRTARWLAALLNCREDGKGAPCGECESCLLFEGDHPDHREVAPRMVTTTGRRSQRPEIRIGQLVPRQGEEDPLSRWLEQRPRFRRRVGVIDGAERLTAAAANSFLKMLEEPPSFAVIVLIAPSTRSVLPTIASRCAVFRFGTVETSGLGQPGHPAHLLGRPGPLLQPSEGAEEDLEIVREFVEALRGDLDGSVVAADRLAERWQAADGSDLGELLRDRLRSLPPRLRVASDDLLLSCEEAIRGFSPAPLAVRVLALELRALLALP